MAVLQYHSPKTELQIPTGRFAITRRKNGRIAVMPCCTTSGGGNEMGQCLRFRALRVTTFPEKNIKLTVSLFFTLPEISRFVVYMQHECCQGQQNIVGLN